jgi:inosine/xanthosine triphosphatase
LPRQRSAAARPLVAIGSHNRAKTLGVRNVFSAIFPGSEFIEVDASSVVRAQPMGLDEVLQGASKRASFSLSEAKADFGVGVEAGILSVTPRGHVNLQIAFIVDRKGNSGLGFSSGFLIPESFVRRMEVEGNELDRYSHELTGAKKITEEEGIVYHLTGGRMSRLQMTEQSVSMALVPWLNRGTYGVTRL